VLEELSGELAADLTKLESVLDTELAAVNERLRRLKLEPVPVL
jgi:hypothetical protein